MGRISRILQGAVLAAWTLLLGAVPTHAGTLSEQDHERYRRAFAAIERGRPAEALRLAQRAEAFIPGKVIQWLIFTDENSTSDFAELAGFLDRNPQWPRLDAVRRKTEAALPKDLPAEEVLLWFEKRPPLSAQGLLRQAEALVAVGRAAEATNLIRRVWTRYDLTEDEENVILERYGEAFRQRDHVNRLDRLLWQRRAGPARQQARRMGDAHAALAEARLLTAFRRKGAEAAVEEVPESLRADPGLVYERARWHRRKRDYENVRALLDPPRPEAPYPETWWRLRRWAAREAIGAGDHEVAYRIASGHGFETGIGFAEGEWLAGWVALRFLDQPQVAYQHFTRLYQRVSTPISRARGAYWAGEAARAKNDPKWVKHWHRIAADLTATFYGQLAAERLGQAPHSVDLPEPAAPTALERQAFEGQELVRAVRILGALGQDEIQKTFLLHLSRLAKTESDFSLTAELAAEQNRPDLALRTAKAARRKGIVLPSYLYPAPPLSVVDGLDPRLIYALIRQESGFYSRAKSHAGARGLMQLMPATAQRMARRIKVSYVRSRLIDDPEYNLLLGQAYIKSMLDRFDGSYVLALAAYNAGPHRVEEWIAANGDPRDPQADTVGWIEMIPFSETRNYVQRVLEAVPVYGARLATSNLATRSDWIGTPFEGSF